MGDHGLSAGGEPCRASALSWPRRSKSRAFFTITGRTVLIGGAKSPDSISGPLLQEIAAAIPSSEVVILPGIGHLAPQDHPDRIASVVLNIGPHSADPTAARRPSSRQSSGWLVRG